MIELVRDYWVYFLIGQYPNGPLGGLALTVLLAAMGLVLALPFGLLLGLARVSPWRWLRWPVTTVAFVVRGTPLLMVVFWAYFFLPTVTGHKTDQFGTMLVALIVFDAAYLAEIVHAGLQALPRGQLQAAMSLGLTRGQALRGVLLPQALRHMLPSLLNQFVATIKETSLGTIIGLSELSFIANQINAQVLVKPVEIYLTLAGSYFVMCFGLTRVARLAETGKRAAGSPSR
jgi:polar amino acid transport system permease protein